MLRVTVAWRRFDSWVSQFDESWARAATDARISDTSWLRERMARRTRAAPGRGPKSAPQARSRD